MDDNRKRSLYGTRNKGKTQDKSLGASGNLLFNDSFQEQSSTSEVNVFLLC